MTFLKRSKWNFVQPLVVKGKASVDLDFLDSSVHQLLFTRFFLHVFKTNLEM